MQQSATALKLWNLNAGEGGVLDAPQIPPRRAGACSHRALKKLSVKTKRTNLKNLSFRGRKAAPQGGLSCPFGAIHLLGISCTALLHRDDPINIVNVHIYNVNPRISRIQPPCRRLPRRFAPRNDREIFRQSNTGTTQFRKVKGGLETLPYDERGFRGGRRPRRPAFA